MRKRLVARLAAKMGGQRQDKKNPRQCRGYLATPKVVPLMRATLTRAEAAPDRSGLLPRP